jgi:hypothetical protein
LHREIGSGSSGNFTGWTTLSPPEPRERDWGSRYPEISPGITGEISSLFPERAEEAFSDFFFPGKTAKTFPERRLCR